ncbi:hypothetical protein F5Y10DRAFT_250366 [Nemania abortiva]|nr:hypothetical protein F5Y10DRAFT_250366 [Nemania abortiva]
MGPSFFWTNNSPTDLLLHGMLLFLSSGDATNNWKLLSPSFSVLVFYVAETAECGKLCGVSCCRESVTTPKSLSIATMQ